MISLIVISTQQIPLPHALGRQFTRTISRKARGVICLWSSGTVSDYFKDVLEAVILFVERCGATQENERECEDER